MKTKKRVDITPEFVEFIPETKDMEENILYISEKYKTASHLCFCGCGEITVTPINKGSWNLKKQENGSVSLSPSVGNYHMPCNSHYIIYKNGANFV